MRAYEAWKKRQDFGRRRRGRKVGGGIGGGLARALSIKGHPVQLLEFSIPINLYPHPLLPSFHAFLEGCTGMFNKNNTVRKCPLSCPF